MSAEKDISLDEKRVYEGDQRETTVYVASGVGVVAVNVVDERVGGFELVARCTARDVAADEGAVAVATDEDVLVGPESFDGTGFGSAVAVDLSADGLLAADDDGRVARYEDGEWRALGTCAGAVRAIDGDLVAADDGVYRATDDGLTHAGLDDVRDVATAGIPRAATAAGLYHLGNGWMDDADGDFTLVASDGDRGHAVGDGDLYRLTDDGWEVHPNQPDATFVGVTYGDTTYAVGSDGRFFAEAPDGWRHQLLGMPDVVAVAGPR
ncbi:HVO_0234 family beta-propeller protein [Haloarchaeobius sp. HRN-SO-5]|uniref:HVO_0234 family beta-propeller protein n=1 Tax=Haloarchaeobius sp. HRN-SO-5 TaxID=3446118 RepID=UPI003EBF9604